MKSQTQRSFLIVTENNELWIDLQRTLTLQAFYGRKTFINEDTRLLVNYRHCTDIFKVIW